MNSAASTSNQTVTRRDFLKSSSVVLAGAATAAQLPFVVTSHAAPDDPIRIGLIGCGGRGTGAVADALGAATDVKYPNAGYHTENITSGGKPLAANIKVAALADVFKDRLTACREQLSKLEMNIPAEMCFVGFDAYQKVIQSGVDVVLLAAPPGFRPAHLKACVEAGKHVFCEKPVAVDGPGVRSVLQTVEEARKKKLTLVSGLCWRYSTAERATFQQVHDGAIGKIVSLASTYLTGPIWNFARQPGWSDMEYQMRNWYYYAWLSGDHIVEQAVHSIDKMAWAMNDEMPVKASAVGGRQVRNTPEFGHIYDHFSVTYDYANGVKGFHSCRQQQGCANETKDYIYGSKGNCEIEGSRRVHVIRGEQEWKYSGTYNNMYQAEHDELFASIRKSEPINDGIRMTHSTLMAILGRMAAYTGQVITWEQALNSQEDLLPPKLDWTVSLKEPEIAMPGMTKFV